MPYTNVLDRKEELQEGLDMIESTNFKYFTKEMTAEFYAFKGLLLAQLGRSEDAAAVHYMTRALDVKMTMKNQTWLTLWINMRWGCRRCSGCHGYRSCSPV
ncbi:Transcription-associated protein 1 [Eumeta japonica]|uniref:Transcription-associated protein 1 n=1 Tax=Eumeta variegata TaxID=151549 RepID=A0A4C2A5L4_EUMVA|nr:Transcription-associated protein 1 [Eumeta japonica]